ncbi:E3 ubiquitin-protein ligase Os04g0590900-like [Miscanthus floridulus]|uniref:E3 ubiquitin-protein ligase Os04g0590900-like n=1 Tax=Miscanthus floridulus TaxID=154761 RepID=UPI00345854A4
MASSPLAISGGQPTWVPYEPTKDCSQGLCSMYCPQWCYFIFPPPPPFDVGGPSPDDSSGPVFSPLVIAIIGVLAIAFLLVSYYTFISRYCGTFGSFRGRVFSSNSGRGARGRGNGGGGSGGQGQSRSQESWNISPSTGLDETLISKITLCKYKRGDASVHTTDCSVCLGEFRDGESLRLLPKCSHAFHQQCIDKWLKSHSNCPLCRSNITFITVGMGMATQEAEGRGPGEGVGRDASHEVVVVMDDMEIMCDEQQSMAGSTDGDGDDQEANGGQERMDEADSKAEIREECPPPLKLKSGPSSSDPDHDIRMSIADVLQASMEDELMAARESGILAGGAGTSRRCHGENSKGGRSSRRALQDAMDTKRLPPAGRSCFSSKSGRGRDSDLPM